MGVTPKAYTREDIKAMDTEGLRTAVPQILKAFNDGDRKDMKLWELYHEAARTLDAARSNSGSQSEWRQRIFDGATEPTPVPPAAPAAPAPTPAVV